MKRNVLVGLVLLIFLLLTLLFGMQAHAQSGCFKWRSDGSGIWNTFTGQEAAQLALESRSPSQCGLPAGSGCSIKSVSNPGMATAAGQKLTVVIQWDHPTFGHGEQVYTFTAVGSPDCPPPADCSSYEGNGSDAFWLLGDQSDTPESTCHKPSGCVATRVSRSCVGSDCVASYSFSSRIQCDGEGGQGEDPDVSEGEGEACVGPWCAVNVNGENCGYLNDSYVCLDSTDEDGCQALEDGGRVCNNDAPVPPSPDAGTPGVKAPPDLVITTDDDTYNYYNNTTVNNSSRPPNASGDNPNDGHDDGDGAGGGGSSGGSGGGLLCTEGEGACTEEGNEGQGDDPRGGWQCWAEGEGLSGAVAQCFKDASEGMWEAISSGSELLSIAQQTAAAFPSVGGSCPSASVEMLPGHSFDFWETPCMFLDDVAAVLQPLFLLFWSFLGLRILLTIPGGE